MKCPVCNVDLLMGERLSISIDYCPQCRGIWLEKGKLDQLLASTANGQPTQRSSGGGGILGSVIGKLSDNDHDHGHSSHGDYGYDQKKHKKKSFFDDLF
ncbi:MAG TPA: zf-TFIIB domain-containing protein [Methanospirillum sp.]|nr:zf-TFIIB domain-containing protein [Methanospirillum sp.]